MPAGNTSTGHRRSHTSTPTYAQRADLHDRILSAWTRHTPHLLVRIHSGVYDRLGVPRRYELACLCVTLGVFVRIALIAAGAILDMAGLAVKYTDVDYFVYTDAAHATVYGAAHNPFDRATYRYTPLLAWLLVPNIVFLDFGKYLFTACDAAIGVLTTRILMHQEVTPRAAAAGVATFMLNPFAINISTRGNADSLVCLAVVAMLYFYSRRRTAASALSFGIAVHLKLFPIIYALPMLWALDEAYAAACTGAHQEHPADSQNPETKQVAALANPDGSAVLASDTDRARSISSPRTRRRSTSRTRSDNHLPSPHVKLRSTWQRQQGHSRMTDSEALFAPRGVFPTLYGFLNRERVLFTVISGASCLLVTAAFYALYGWTFLYEAYLYHFVRADNRHNFSMYFYDIYLGMDNERAGGAVGAAAFATPVQILLGLAVAFAFRRDISTALFLQTWIFIAFNKVITVQYFHWMMALLPLAAVQNTMGWRRAGALFLLWLVFELQWNIWAGLLELAGQATFRHVWLASVAFFAANVCCICVFIRHQQPGGWLSLKAAAASTGVVKKEQ